MRYCLQTDHYEILPANRLQWDIACKLVTMRFCLQTDHYEILPANRSLWDIVYKPITMIYCLQTDHYEILPPFQSHHKKRLPVKIAFFWDAMPHDLIEVYRRFRETVCLHYDPDYVLLPSWEQKQLSTRPPKRLRYHNPENQMVNTKFVNAVCNQSFEGSATFHKRPLQCT